MPIPASLTTISRARGTNRANGIVRDKCRKQLHDRVAAFIKNADGAQ